MSSAFILQQSAAFGPGRITSVLRDFGIPVKIRKLFSGDEVPTDLDEFRLLVVLGGTMRIGDVESNQYPYLSKEVELLKRMVAIDRPVLGIGLGAQLLAHAAGAKVATATTACFGWSPVTFPFPGGTEPMVMGLFDGAPMFHWHQDNLELPRLPAPPPTPGTPPAPSGNALLSSSAHAKNEAFRFKTRLFGFQYHPELTADDIQVILASAKTESGAVDHAKITQDTAKHMGRYTRLGDRLLRNFVQFTKTY